MTDKPAKTPTNTQATQTELIPSQAGQASAIASMNAPFLYSDCIGTYGVNPDLTVANISLEVVRHMPVGEKSVADRVIVAHLRLPMRTLASLKETIEKILLIASPVPETEKN